MMQKILNILSKIFNILMWPFRKILHIFLSKKLIQQIEAGLMEDFLIILLKVIRLACHLDKKYRRNIEQFNARYVFRSENEGKQIIASAIFKDNKIIVMEKEIPDPTVKVFFDSPATLWNFLTNSHPDIFAFVLDNKLRYEGNLNYLMKFGYMGMHLKKMLLPG